MINRYECSICGKLYSKAADALTCEIRSTKMPRHKIGDIIEIETRYDGLVQDKVLKVEYVAHGWLVTTESYHQTTARDPAQNTFYFED